MINTATARAGIIAEIVNTGGCSRSELAGRLKTSKASAGRAVERLIAAGWVAEGAKSRDVRRGPKATALSVRPDLVYTIGTDLEGTAIRACLIDCSNRVVASAKCGFDARWRPGTLLRTWRQLIERIIATSGVDKEKIIGVGLGFPGVGHRVDDRSYYHVRAHLPPGRLVDLEISQALPGVGLPFTPANNTICVSEYERRLGRGNGARSFISVLIRFGIGAAVFSRGAFLMEEDAIAGEIGHMRIDLKGPLCICGNKGCLDVFASGRTWPPPGKRYGPRWRKEIRQRSRYLGIALAGLLKVFHSPLVILNGIYNDFEDDVIPVLRDVWNKELETLGLPAPEVVSGDPNEWKVSIGAALRARDKFLEPYLIRHLFPARRNPRRTAARLIR